MVHRIAEKAAPQLVDRFIDSPQFGQAAGLRRQFFFQKQYLSILAESDNFFFEFSEIWQPWIGGIRNPLASFACFQEPLQHHSQHPVFEAAYAAFPI